MKDKISSNFDNPYCLLEIFQKSVRRRMIVL